MPASERHDDLPVFVLWFDFVEWLLQRTEKFPKSARFAFTSRIEALALDVLEDIVEARYTRERAPILRRANLRIERLRILLRLAFRRRFLAITSYEHASRGIDEAGRMLGGWTRQQESAR